MKSATVLVLAVKPLSDVTKLFPGFATKQNRKSPESSTSNS
ncbi:hypothetical protein EVA_13812 [gut metagenome]|uniref:Uncharacterized protein n=1 Tax=gut metagenome TaxID=749906 RepID=J9GFH2_9ZZZZ